MSVNYLTTLIFNSYKKGNEQENKSKENGKDSNNTYWSKGTRKSHYKKKQIIRISEMYVFVLDYMEGRFIRY